MRCYRREGRNWETGTQIGPGPWPALSPVAVSSFEVHAVHHDALGKLFLRSLEIALELTQIYCVLTLVLWQASTARPGAGCCPTTSRPSSSRRQNVVRSGGGNVRHVEAFQMGSVRISIIGEPRPLPGYRRAAPSYTPKL